MSKRYRYDLNLENLPMMFDTDFGNYNCTMQINYNDVGDFYTVDLFDVNNNPVILGEKLVYGKRLWSDYTNPDLPIVDLVPLDESGRTTVCNKETFGKTVFLYIDTVVD
ncbi:hypothetical protein B6U43_02735 [Ligilactobacillus salivarius]|uniref:phage baseplate plug family protein n=1 Tax=Ligilactobacillus salivarius TaxID=1624 RepID=UPI0009D95057|nr:hypothetical protein [Ligilactobacillus salivarius]MBD5789382.1 hypothetical protein [Ligilactobacillus salivarius]MBM6786918.1 hypothetical protein [Ligilactobacillus salivarius]MBZ4031493.1 hypothetical protein [Ligilactobacillus salivarius]OQR15948.1 hypothetical protein B6U43_02735 [Ligilactobacillus salivarius]